MTARSSDTPCQYAYVCGRSTNMRGLTASVMVLHPNCWSPKTTPIGLSCYTSVLGRLQQECHFGASPHAALWFCAHLRRPPGNDLADGPGFRPPSQDSPDTPCFLRPLRSGAQVRFALRIFSSDTMSCSPAVPSTVRAHVSLRAPTAPLPRCLEGRMLTPGGEGGGEGVVRVVVAPSPCVATLAALAL